MPSIGLPEVTREDADYAGRYLELDATQLDFRHGQVYRQGAEDPLLGLDDLVRLAGPASPYNLEEPGLEATAYFKSDQLTYTYGTHVAHVAVDPRPARSRCCAMWWWRTSGAASIR